MAETPKQEKIPGDTVNYKHHREHIDACEEGDGHVVQPTVWPPTSSDGTMGLECIRCHCHVVVYADGRHAGIKIDMAKVRKAPAA